MTLNHKRWKQWVRGALLVVLVLDLALLVARWRLAAAASEAQLRESVRKLEAQTTLLSANLDRAAAIRGHLPQVSRNCDRFFSDDLLGASDGYSALVADLGQIASQAGLKTSGVRFQQKEVPQRGVIEVAAAATIEGDYPGLIRFINGLERSKNFYLLDSLTLASSAAGRIKLNVHLRTYFRS